MKKPAKGDAFLREKTGSATMINLDGKWEHDFYDDNTPAPGRDRRIAEKTQGGRETADRTSPRK